MRNSDKNASGIRPMTRLTGVMAVFALFSILAGALGDLATAAHASGVRSTVIVQLTTEPAAVWKAREERAGRSVSAEALQTQRNGIRSEQDAFLGALAARGVSFDIDGVDVPNFDGSPAGRVDFRYNLVYNGIALNVPANAVSVIRSMPQVRSVRPSRDLKLDLEKSVSYVRAPQNYGQYAELTPFDSFNEGYEGQGINVAVLDTGIDWTHAMFGGDPTPPRLGLAPPTAAANSNQKVNYYMTFTGGLPDDFGHGTAAASNIAGYLGMAPGADGIPATADDVRVHGVAPQARLMGYKVCLGVGVCPEPGTILAIEDAVSPVTLTLQPKPIAHVINLSLGGSGGPDDPSAVASSNAALMGTIVVASAGNEGPGQSTVGSPAAGTHVIAVGANTDPAGGVNTVDVVAGDRSGMIANLLDGAAAVTADITSNYVYCGLAETPDQVPDSVRGKIALIARGGSVNVDQPPAPGAGTGLFSNKAAFAFAKGAIAVLVYNNVDGELEAATVRASTIPVMGMNKANGEFLRSLIGSTAFGAVSAKTIRINRDKVFSPAMAAFSSRGPVQGLGQIKPDVTAPGVGVLSATIRVGSADANGGTMFDPTGYTPASGTSFSGPHVTGAAALVKQAHLGWTPDMVRTALVNTATNLRSASGTPKADGEQADSIIAQGGGLIDIQGAVNAKALMGVAGDGITTPGILGSHSFGEMPILNNRIINTREVTVTLRDVSGQGGTYDLSTVNNRNFDRAGISSTLSQSSVSVPPGGSAAFTARVTLDGTQVQDASTLDLQWYVKATRAGSGESLRMPMFLRANPSLPGATAGGAQSETVNGNIAVGDGGAQSTVGLWAAEGISYDDIPITAPAGTVRLEADLQFADVAGGLPDLDLYVFGPDGSEVTKSTNAGGPENVSVPVTQNGTYIFRVAGWVNADTNYTFTSRKFDAGAPVLDPIAADFVEAAAPGLRYSFDGSYDLTWQSTSTVDAYEIEESSDGDNWSVIRTVAGGVTSTSFTDAAEGTHIYRVRAIVPGQIGKFVTQPSNLSTIIVRKRAEVDATGSIDAVNSSITFPPGATNLTTALRNNSSTVFYPHVRFEIVAISSAGNSVRVSNADSGGDGVSSAAVFDYSQLVGYDFVPNEVSGSKQIRFSNPNMVLFTFTARVKANVSTAGPLNEGSKAARTDTKAVSTEPRAAESATRLLQFTVNPLTNSVSIRLL